MIRRCFDCQVITCFPISTIDSVCCHSDSGWWVSSICCSQCNRCILAMPVIICVICCYRWDLIAQTGRSPDTQRGVAEQCVYHRAFNDPAIFMHVITIYVVFINIFCEFKISCVIKNHFKPVFQHRTPHISKAISIADT